MNLSALRRERPSEIVLLFGLIRIAVAAIAVGTALAFVFGLWLVHEAGYGYGDGWVIAAIVLLIVGERPRRRGRQARRAHGAVRAGARRRRATRRARSCSARVRDPISLALSYGSGLLLIAVLALMIWKPGA